jgi:hypothetical protein
MQREQLKRLMRKKKRIKVKKDLEDVIMERVKINVS